MKHKMVLVTTPREFEKVCDELTAEGWDLDSWQLFECEQHVSFRLLFTRFEECE